MTSPALTEDTRSTGSSSVSYVYDENNRLISADGHCNLIVAEDNDVPSAKLPCKQPYHQSPHAPDQPASLWFRRSGSTNFSSSYTYQSGRPHLPNRIGELVLTYDPSGNPTTRTTPSTSTVQTLTWDDDGRMVDFQGGGVNQHNTYDASGLRVRRKSTQSETVFTSSLFDVENSTQGVRHVFAGDVRVASELTKYVSGENPVAPDKRGTAYFFHGDHLKNATVLTADDGSVYQSLEYFATVRNGLIAGPRSHRISICLMGSHLIDR